MAEQKQMDISKMTLYECRDAVAKNEKEVMSIRKFAHLQNITYSEAVKGLYELCRAIQHDKVKKNDGSNAPITQNVKFDDGLGWKWSVGPFVISISVSITNENPLTIKVDASLEFDEFHIKLGPVQFSKTIVFDGPTAEVTILNTSKVQVYGTLGLALLADGIFLQVGIKGVVHFLGTHTLGPYTKDFGPIDVPEFQRLNAAQQVPRDQVIAVTLGVQNAKTGAITEESLDPTQVEGVMWSDRGVVDIIGGFYDQLDQPLSDQQKARLNEYCGKDMKINRFTKEIVKDIWDTPNPKTGTLRSHITKLGGCIIICWD